MSHRRKEEHGKKLRNFEKREIHGEDWLLYDPTQNYKCKRKKKKKKTVWNNHTTSIMLGRTAMTFSSYSHYSYLRQQNTL
jgi:hypothetical protein